MRLLFTVQRYHADVVGGSEAACRGYAEHLAAEGHDVTVATSCSTSHHDWANSLDDGVSIINGVTVVRFPVARARTEQNFGRIHRRINGNDHLMAWEQALWSQRIGPDLVGYAQWLATNAHRFDAAIVMTYMYPTTSVALRLLPQRIPTVFVPTAHDEPAFRLSAMAPAFRQPQSFGFLTPEEEDLVRRWHRATQPSEVIGVGVDLPQVVGDYPRIRRELGLGDDPYLVCVGRVDAGKGTRDLLSMFSVYSERHSSHLRLVLVGEDPSTSAPGVTALGFLSDEEKHAVIAGAVALVQPSFMESFSIVLCEAWAHEVPVVVNRLCAVTAGQVTRAHGGLAFGRYDEFEYVINELLHHDVIRRSMGATGRRFVGSEYAWPAVTGRLLSTVNHAVAAQGARPQSAEPMR